MREVCLCNVLQIILKNSLACQFRIVCTEHKNAFATKQEGVHIGNADACLAEGGNSISRSSRSIVDFKGKAIFEQLKCTTAWRERFLQVVALLRVVFKFDAMKASPTFDIELEDIQSPEATLGKIFRYLEEADCPCIVAIDEFHQVTAYTEQNTEALLRTHIQQCSQTNFIFSGSKRHLMTQMFNSSAKPFYQSAMEISIQLLERAVYADFARCMFVKNGCTLADGVAKEVYDYTESYTWFMQMLMNELFALTPMGSICTTDLIAKAQVIFFKTMYSSPST